MEQRSTVFLVNLGTPQSATEEGVREFLAEFLADPLVVDWPAWIWRPVLHGIVLRSRPRRVAAMYRSVWSATGSPLAAGTLRLAAALQVELGESHAVRAVYRYGAPGFAAELRTSLAAGGRVDVVPLFPQRTASSSGTLERQFTALVQEHAAQGRARWVAVPPDLEGYVAAVAARVHEACGAAAPPDPHLVISFHGVPVRHDRREGGRYRADCQVTASALRRALQWKESHTRVAFQSRFGPERWLSPSTQSVLEELPRQGVRHVVVVAPGFLTDGLETLEELGIRGRELFLRGGGESFALAGAVVDQPAFVAALAGLLRR